MAMKVAVIGAGTIGSAVAKALSEAGHEVVATRRKVEKVKWLEDYGVEVTNDNIRASEWAEVVFLAVKPNKVSQVLEEIGRTSGEASRLARSRDRTRLPQEACPGCQGR
jgi:pyrroline-5-carboxylate reductase